MDPSIKELAAQISQLASALSSEIGARGLPEPSLSQGSLDAYPTDEAIQKPRMALIDAAQSLLNLAIGPTDYLNWQAINTPQDLNALHILYKFDFFHIVPLNGTISNAELAQKTDLSEQLIRRIIDRAIIMSLFRETAPGSGLIEHTSFSAEVVKKPGLQSWIGHMMEEEAPAAVRTADALKKYSAGGREKGSPRETGMALHFFPDAPDHYSFFDFLAEDGQGGNKGYRGKRFAQVMAHDAKGGARGNATAFHQVFGGENLASATVMDVGGSTGHISIEIAKQFPDLRFIVSDLPETEVSFNQSIANSGLPKDRISFLGHNFFQPWPQINVDIIMLKQVLHDWSDQYAAKLLRNLIPILKPGTRLFIIESAMADSIQNGAPLVMKKFRSSFDLAMLALLNGRERTSSDWEELFTSVDKRFKVKSTGPVPESRSMYIDIVFDEEGLKQIKDAKGPRPTQAKL